MFFSMVSMNTISWENNKTTKNREDSGDEYQSVIVTYDHYTLEMQNKSMNTRIVMDT